MPQNLFDLSGQVALITGSTRGIGRAIALRLAQHGARVVISSRKADACEAVRAEVAAAGGEAMAAPCNIADKAQLQALVDATLARWGRIDTLVCNAAVNPYFGPLQNLGDDAFDKILQANVKANLWLCQMVLPGMAERGGGSVLIISSVAGLLGTATLGAYGVSKAADMALTRNLAVEWGPRNIRVNCVAPGIIKTDFSRALWDDPRIHDAAVRQYPLRRIGLVDEVAGYAVLLASPAGAFTTGQTFVIDGGGSIAAGAA